MGMPEFHLPKFGFKGKKPKADVDVDLPSGEIDTPDINVEIKKPSVDVDIASFDVKGPSVDLSGPSVVTSLPTPTPSLESGVPLLGFKGPKLEKPDIHTDVAAPSISVGVPQFDTDISKPQADVDLPAFDVTIGKPEVTVEVPKLDVAAPKVAEEKSSRFSFGFGKKGKKKKEKSPKPVPDDVKDTKDVSIAGASLEGTVDTSTIPPPKPPRLDAKVDGSAALSISGPSDALIEKPSSSSIISGNEISVSLSDGKVLPNLGGDIQDSLPSQALEKDPDRSLVPKMGLSAKLSKPEVETVGPKPEVKLELPSIDIESHDVEKKGSFSFGFGSKRDKKKKQKKDDERQSPDANIGISVDTAIPDVDGSGVMKNWYKDKSKSPTKDKKKPGGLSLGFGSKSDKESVDVEAKINDLDVPQDAKVKKKGSFLGGLIKK